VIRGRLYERKPPPPPPPPPPTPPQSPLFLLPHSRWEGRWRRIGIPPPFLSCRPLIVPPFSHFLPLVRRGKRLPVSILIFFFPLSHFQCPFFFLSFFAETEREEIALAIFASPFFLLRSLFPRSRKGNPNLSLHIHLIPFFFSTFVK